MRWFAAATVSLVLCGTAIGCGSDGGAGFLPEGVAGAGEEAGSSGSGTAGKAGAASTGEAGEAGSIGSEAGSAGADPSDAGASSGGADNGGTSGGDSGGTGGSTAGMGGSSAGSGGTGGAVVPAAPSAPTTLVLSVTSSTSVHLTWADTADNETGYKVYWATTSEKPATANAELGPNVLQADAAGLTANQEYSFWVEAYNDVGASTAVTGKATPIPVPAAPTGFSIAAGATDAVLSWTDAATTETGYRVYFATENTKPAVAQAELPAGANTYTVLGSAITAYTQYYYWVEAFNVVGASMAATGSATTGVAPIAPQGVTVDPNEKIWYVNVSWLDYSDNAGKFNVYWSTNDTKPATPGASVPAGTTSYKMTAVYGDQTYRFWIEAENVKGKSSATKGTAPNKTYDLVWRELYYDAANNTIHHTMQDTFGLATDNDATTTMWGYHSPNQTLGTASAINPGINWNITTAAIDTSVNQNFWSEFRTPLGSHFSTRSLTAPTPATSFAVNTPTNLAANLTWTAGANVSTYQVYMNTGATDLATATLFSSPTGTAQTVTDLNPGTSYTFWLRALGNGTGGPGMPTTYQSKTVTMGGTYVGPNLAKGKTAVASSATGDVAVRVVDGNLGTRWQAAVNTANEWIYVDLGAATNITHVKLVWEAAYAKTYDIELCTAGCGVGAATTWTWTTAYTSPTNTFAGFPYFDMVTLTTAGSSRYVRMRAKTLATVYGASLYEFEVFSAP